MAENEDRDQPETSPSSPNSTAAALSGPKASKDRSCPFCGQAFTSSSLGRHLDLYIKPKNPKPPDGVHDVHEIKKLRGSITRRQPRASMKSGEEKEDGHRRSSSGWQSGAGNKPARAETRLTDSDRVNSPVNSKEEGLHTWLNAASWQATGVINNLPARSPSRNQTSTPTGQAQRVQDMRRDTTGNRIERPEYVSEDMWKLQESAEVGRAAEMALREVLGSLQAAKRKAEPQKLFDDFDFCTLSFPGLCLALLPPPSALFSSTPFSAAHTWSLAPPGDKHFDAMNRKLNERIATMRNGVFENVPDSIVFRHNVHLQGAWEHWQLMSESDKTAAWNLEVSRAFVREREKKQQLLNDLEAANQRIRHLEAEYERMSRCQLPREYLLHPPNTMAVSDPVMKEMKHKDQNSGAWEADYDANALINKWKAKVKATTRPTKPPPTQASYTEPNRNPLKADMVINGSVYGVNGIMSRGLDAAGNNDNQAAVTYETPQYPGAVIGAEDEKEVDADADADGEAEEDVRNYGDYTNQGGLTRLRSANKSPYDSSLGNTLNANGKRHLAPTSVNGRGSGPKVYRELAKS